MPQPSTTLQHNTPAAVTPDAERPRGSDGCGFVLLTFLFVCAALIFNGMLVTGLYIAVLSGALQQQSVYQLIAFLLPLVALFLEWWLLDWFVDWTAPHDPDA